MRHKIGTFVRGGGEFAFLLAQGKVALPQRELQPTEHLKSVTPCWGESGARPLTGGSGCHVPTWEVGFSSGLGPKESKMQSNAMTKCAVGAMLFGGTLGLTQAASAGVTWLSSTQFGPATLNPINYANVFSLTDSYNYATDSSGGASALNSFSFAYEGVSLGISETTSAGFSMSVSSVPVGGGYGFDLSAVRYLQVSGSVDFSVNLNLPSFTQLAFTVSRWNSATSQQEELYSLLGNGAESGTLTTGVYQISMRGNSEAPVIGTFATFTVPAPGAVALLGAAGMIARRRKA
jgi:hypothetical protein